MSRRDVSFQTMAEASPHGMVIWEPSGAICHANRAFAALLGYGEAELVSLNYWVVTAAAQKQREINHILTKEREPYEKEFLTKDGAHLSVQASGFAIDPSGSRNPDEILFAAVVRPTFDAAADGDQKERERALRRQNALLLSLARSPTISSGDFSAAIREITEATARGLGVSRASVWLYDDEKRRILCHDLYELEKQQHATGAELFANDFPNYFAALAEDRAITADDAHTHPATREFSAVYLAPLGIQSMLEAPLRFRGELIGVLCHEHCRERRIWTQEDVVFAGTMADFVSHALEAAERKRAEQALQKLNEELEERVEERARELKAANALVLRLQKEITETQMAGGFAHEMRNALSSAKIIISKVTSRDGESGVVPTFELEELLNELFLLVKDRLDEDAIERAREIFSALLERAQTMSEVLVAINNAVERALKITTQIMDYSRLGQSKRGTAEVNFPELVRTIIAETRPQLFENRISVDVEFSGPQLLFGSESHFHSMVKNILLNASDALAEVSDDRPRGILVRYAASADSVELSVKDNGVGMSDEVKERIYEPFFTTKPRTGTGLGMGMVRKLISLYGGTIEIDSVDQTGTTIRLKLPSSLLAAPQTLLPSAE